MKKSIYWILATILTCGATVMTSCGSDDSTVDLNVSANIEQPKNFGGILKKVKNNMGNTNFGGLAPLALGLNNGTAVVNCDDIADQDMDQFIESLNSLLERLLCCNGEANGDAQDWKLGDLMETLRSAIDVSRLYEQLSDNIMLGNGEYNRAFDIVLNDTLAYKVALDMQRDMEAKYPVVNGKTQRQLTISKNGTVLLTIDTSQEGMVGIVDNKFGVNTANTGSLTYNDLKFTFDRQTYGGDSIAKNLAFFKDGLSIIKITTKNSNNLTLDNLLSKNVAFKGNMEITALEGLMNLRSDISNLNKFYATGLALVGLGLTGTTKDICQKQADAFNSIVSSQFLFGGDMKEMFVEPMLADSVRNIYVPSLILQADPANGGEKVTLMEALEAIGVAFENLMQLFAE